MLRAHDIFDLQNPKNSYISGCNLCGRENLKSNINSKVSKWQTYLFSHCTRWYWPFKYGWSLGQSATASAWIWFFWSESALDIDYCWSHLSLFLVQIQYLHLRKLYGLWHIVPGFQVLAHMAEVKKEFTLELHPSESIAVKSHGIYYLPIFAFF